jgi:hypothetical protein
VLGGEVQEAARLLATVVGQDLEQTEDGLFRIARGVAPDRVISTVDPEARHGHKTSARGFDGYKGHIAIDPDSEIITGAGVTAANVGCRAALGVPSAWAPQCGQAVPRRAMNPRWRRWHEARFAFRSNGVAEACELGGASLGRSGSSGSGAVTPPSGMMRRPPGSRSCSHGGGMFPTASRGVTERRTAMLEKLKDLPQGVEGLRASGKVSKDDYDRVFVPILEDARREGRRLRLLYHLGPAFEGFTASGAWEDAKLGMRFLRMFDGCAVVTDVRWLQDSTRLAGFMMPCPVRAFADRDRDEAITWLNSLPEAAAVSHRLLPDSGVMVVEVQQPLREEDFDALALTADAWIATHGDLQGLVIHARAFPGWENLGSALHHLRFVRDHHRKIKRIALATDSAMATIAPLVAEHFIQAEIKSFAYDGIDDAIAWAGARPTRSAATPTAGAPAVGAT